MGSYIPQQFTAILTTTTDADLATTTDAGPLPVSKIAGRQSHTRCPVCQDQATLTVQARHLHQSRLLRAAPPPPLPPSPSSSPSSSRASTAPVTAGDLQGPSTQLQLEARATMGVNFRSGSASQKRRGADPPAGTQVHYFTIVNVATVQLTYFSLSRSLPYASIISTV